MKACPFIKRDRRILVRILNFSRAKNVKLYIVGGLLRDIILGRAGVNLDIDFAIKKNAIRFASRLAKQLKAGFVVLDKVNGCARLVRKEKDRLYTLDFTDFRGRDLLHDLAKRDFSINAIAVDLKAFLEAMKLPARKRYGFLVGALIDPCKGLDDLRAGIIRQVDSYVFKDDPLRILRAFSLSSILNFKIERKTLELAEKKRNKLSTVSGERIRDELFKILSSPRAYESLSQLDKHRILELIFPEIKSMRRLNQGPYHHLDVLRHTLETIRQLESLIRSFSRNKEVRDYLDEEVSSGRYRHQLLKLGGLLHDIGKPKTMRIEEGKIKFHGHERVGANMLDEVSKRLKLANIEIAILKKMIMHHLRPGYLADNPVLTPRAKFRFFRDAANDVVGILLVSLADQRATRGSLTTQESRQRHERLARRLIKDYFQKKKEKKTERLINGNDLIRHFKLQPSPIIGKILSGVEEEQAIGRIKTKEEALRIAKKLIKEQVKKHYKFL